MSFRDQLNRVFSEDEMKLLTKMVDEERIAAILGMTSVDKRLLQSIRDKLVGRELIRKSQTTPPGRL